MEDRPISEAYMLIMELYKKLGNPIPIKEPWTHTVDANWIVAINPKKESCEFEPIEGMKVSVEPYHAAIWWNGWLAGIIHPFGGSIVAHPSESGANEDNLIKALKVQGEENS